MEDNQFEYMTVQLDRVVDDKRMLPITRLLAVDLQKNPFLSVGRFLEELSDDDLRLLSGIAEDETDSHFNELILIAEMLAFSEGVVKEYSDMEQLSADAYQRLKTLIAYIAVEGLARLGYVKVFRENMSFGDDYADKMICEKI